MRPISVRTEYYISGMAGRVLPRKAVVSMIGPMGLTSFAQRLCAAENSKSSSLSRVIKSNLHHL